MGLSGLQDTQLLRYLRRSDADLTGRKKQITDYIEEQQGVIGIIKTVTTEGGEQSGQQTMPRVKE